MISHDSLMLFVVASVLLALTPGPNMLYLVSRTLAQGRTAGLVSLTGTTSGLLIHVLAAALGLSAVLIAIPVAYDVLRWAGAAYLLWLAWDAIRPAATRTRSTMIGAGSVSSVEPAKLFQIGLLTSILNPKVALFYLALFPQFVDPSRGSVFAQSLMLGVLQILIAIVCDATFVLTAARVARWLGQRPAWAVAQRWLLAGVFATIAVKLAIDDHR